MYSQPYSQVLAYSQAIFQVLNTYLTCALFKVDKNKKLKKKIEKYFYSYIVCWILDVFALEDVIRQRWFKRLAVKYNVKSDVNFESSGETVQRRLVTLSASIRHT